MGDEPTFVVVSALEHPDVDEWVMEQARAEAVRSGVHITAYLGREDALPKPRPPDVSCHVFTAIYRGMIVPLREVVE